MTDLLAIEDLGIELPHAGAMRPVVSGVSLSLADGETVALVGESGAGKSMVAKAVGRILPAGARVSGRIVFDGEPVLEMDRSALRRYRSDGVGFVFQDPRAAINPVRKVGDFLVESLVANRDASRTAARGEVAELLKGVGIKDAEHRLQQYPHQLSGGLLQRVMIASVLAMRPRLIVADEPTTALDVTTQAEVMAILKERQERFGLAMLMITHDLELAAAVCERTAVMYAGMLMEERRSAQIHADPLHPYSAALLTSRPEMAVGKERLAVISGRPLSASEAPAGCPFRTRCSFAAAQCSETRPRVSSLDGGRVACVRAQELRGNVWPTAETTATHTDDV